MTTKSDCSTVFIIISNKSHSSNINIQLQLLQLWLPIFREYSLCIKNCIKINVYMWLRVTAILLHFHSMNFTTANFSLHVVNPCSPFPLHASSPKMVARVKETQLFIELPGSKTASSQKLFVNVYSILVWVDKQLMVFSRA